MKHLSIINLKVMLTHSLLKISNYQKISNLKLLLATMKISRNLEISGNN